jgi:hypothetical protein
MYLILLGFLAHFAFPPYGGFNTTKYDGGIRLPFSLPLTTTLLFTIGLFTIIPLLVSGANQFGFYFFLKNSKAFGTYAVRCPFLLGVLFPDD